MLRKPGQKAARFGEKGMRLVRSWETLLLLIESPTPLMAQEINAKVHRDFPFCDHPCSVQTTREDLKTLQKSGFPLVMIDEQGHEIDPDELESAQGRLKNVRWQIRDPDYTTLQGLSCYRLPNSSDLIALSLCRALLHDDMMPTGGYPLSRIINKLLSELQTRINYALRTGAPAIADLPGKIQCLGRRFVGKAVEAEAWSTIAAAISRRQVLVGEYQNREGETKQIDIAPLAVWFSDGRAYLLAVGTNDLKVRTWRIDRLGNLKAALGRTTPKIDEDTIQSHIQSSFKGFVATPATIRLRVKPQAAYLFHEFQYHPTQQLTECEDGSLVVTMECTMGWGLEEWLLGFGELATVIEPEALKERLRTRFVTAVENYR